MNIREPLQKRTREAWARVLDAGVSILIESGYDGFTIAAVCAAAEVAPRFIYDRVDSKEDLFLAVYEHGIERLRSSEDRLDQWADAAADTDPEHLVRGAVHEIGAPFREHPDFLHRIVLLSGSHPAVAARGAETRAAFEARFEAVLLPIGERIAHDDPAAAIRYCFDTAFSAWVVRVGYGPRFSALGLDDGEFDTELQELAARYLLR